MVLPSIGQEWTGPKMGHLVPPGAPQDNRGALGSIKQGKFCFVVSHVDLIRLGQGYTSILKNLGPKLIMKTTYKDANNVLVFL